MKPLSVNGAGERNSQAQNPDSFSPWSTKNRSMKANPSSSGTGRRNSTRSILWPSSARTPAEYWNTPGM